MTHLKHTEGMFSNEACRFKTGEDLNNLCAGLNTHFKRHGLDTVTCRNNPNDEMNMMSVFTSHPLFTVESMRTINFVMTARQSNDDAIECFMNSLREDLRCRIQVKCKESMFFTNTFMMFVNIE